MAENDPIPVSINSDSLVPNPVVVDPGNKVLWTNNSGVTVDLTLPLIFAPPPQNPISLPSGSSTRVFNVNNRPGSYPYSVVSSDVGLPPRDGTIDVR